MNSPAWLAIVRAAWKRKRGIPADRKEREARAEQARREAQGEATKQDWQRWEAERK
jgi:hypothetical protein